VGIYLPIAGLSINAFMLLGMGAAIGFLSGLFGIGGGFLLIPLLIFNNIPPTVAVASVPNQVIASSFSGVLTHFKRGTIDLKLGALLLVGGIGGSLLGVYVYKILKGLGQFDLVVSILYVVLLGTIGSLMMVESLRALNRSRKGGAPSLRKPGQHSWVHRLPLKMRFRASKLYVSIIPVLGLGAMIGFMSSSMGIGGGFVMVPAMIYLLKVPTKVVSGTSLFQVMFVSSFTTVAQSLTNHSVDVVLALLLMLGGVAGAQYGTRVGQRLRGEQLRALLALLVLAVGVRLAYELVVTPDNPFSAVIVSTPGA
jgi:uncharacterized membrane protein YfcA